MNELAFNIVLIVLLLANLLVLILLTANIRSVVASFFDSMSAPDENTPSSLAQLVDQAGHSMGRAVAMEVKTTMMGKASGEARLAQAINSDIAQDSLAADQPGIAALLDMFPSLKKRATKNPGVVDFLLSRLSTGGPGGPLVRLPGNGGGSYASRLGKYA